MTMDFSVEINSIRDINHFYYLNRRYSSVLDISMDKENLYDCNDYTKVPVTVTAKGNESELSELHDAYCLFGIAS